LSKDEAEPVSSSWLYRKEAWHNAAISVGEEAALRREKGGDDVSWANANLTGSKNEENLRGRSSSINGQ
jgi:hypothetical protein